MHYKMPTGGGYKLYVPTLRERFFRALGFRWPAQPEDWERPGLAEGYVSVRTVIQFDFWDRLRVLVGGPVALIAAVKSNVLIADSETRANVGVLPPGSR